MLDRTFFAVLDHQHGETVPRNLRGIRLKTELLDLDQVAVPEKRVGRCCDEHRGQEREAQACCPDSFPAVPDHVECPPTALPNR